MIKQYDIIYLDPPWSYRDNKSNSPKLGGKTYPTMTLEELKQFPIHKIAKKDCYIFMWAVKPMLPEAFELISTWKQYEFEYKTTSFEWIKLNPSIELPATIHIDEHGNGQVYSGLGYYTNGNVEDVLLIRRGKTIERISKSVKQPIFWPRGRHSEKPQEVKRRIEKMLGRDLQKIELFAREKFLDGWDYMGNEIDSDIPLDYHTW
jgi:site-specific DNA-methyltransferase (adenine-specific)